MKNFLYIIALFLSLSATAQTYSIAIVNPQVIGSNLRFTIRMSSSTGTLKAGAFNLALNYPIASLSTGTLVSDIFTNAPNYTPTSVVSASGKMTFNVNYNGSAGGGVTIPAEGVDAGVVNFVITNPAAIASLTWRTTGAAPKCVFYADDNATLIALGTATGLTNQALPVELNAFSARAVDNVNVLTWKTAMEKNTDYFVAERSANGHTDWTTVATVKAAGNAQVENTYTATDATPLSMSYYRIRTIDTDGKEQISNVVSVARRIGRLNITKVYPVPTSDNLNVQFEAKADETVSIEVTNVLGQIVMQRSFAAKTGFNALELDMTALKTGAYILTLENGKEAVTQRIIKQ